MCRSKEVALPTHQDLSINNLALADALAKHSEICQPACNRRNVQETKEKLFFEEVG